MKHQLCTEPMKQLISKNKYEELHQHLVRLNWKQQVAIQMRFWEECTILQIASDLGVTWEEADNLIDSALGVLKDGLINSRIHSTIVSAA